MATVCFKFEEIPFQVVDTVFGHVKQRLERIIPTLNFGRSVECSVGIPGQRTAEGDVLTEPTGRDVNPFHDVEEADKDVVISRVDPGIKLLHHGVQNRIGMSLRTT